MKNRRSFIKSLLGMLGLGLVAFNSGVAYAKKLALPLDKVKSLQRVGGSARVKIAGNEILLIRDSESSVRGLSSTCTHMGCDVTYNATTSKIDCKCHGSSFDLNGKVLRGPAVKDLKTYTTSLTVGRILVSVE